MHARLGMENYTLKIATAGIIHDVKTVLKDFRMFYRDTSSFPTSRSRTLFHSPQRTPAHPSPTNGPLTVVVHPLARWSIGVCSEMRQTG